MTEITRVPLQPIARGALSKLWVGLAALALIAGGLAWATVPHGVNVEVVEAGSGDTPDGGDVVFANYTGRLADGTVFDEAKGQRVPLQGLFPDGAPLSIGQMIPGMNDALTQVQKGGKYVIEIPADLGYGDEPPPGSNIPAGADLIFDLEVVEIMPQAEFEQRVGLFQQMMQMQGGAPHGGGDGVPPLPPQP
jgi:FKBP-type peptidyl-prolyl cis-trans isomerase FkpA